MAAFTGGSALRERNLHFQAAQGLRGRDTFYSLEMKDCLAEMNAAGKNPDRPGSASSSGQPSLSPSGKPLRKIREDFGGHLAPPAPRAQDARQGQGDK